jgi:hypothetical protein
LTANVASVEVPQDTWTQQATHQQCCQRKSSSNSQYFDFLWPTIAKGNNSVAHSGSHCRRQILSADKCQPQPIRNNQCWQPNW